MACFRLTVAYDGTGLVGWQRQATGVSVQALLEDAAATLEGAAVTVIGAGRTDAGVHALGQVASLSLTRPMAAATLQRALNAHLPPAVRILAAAVADPSFHARFGARSKLYRYHLWNGLAVPPILRGFVWHVPGQELDVAAMDAAARRLEGRHDFAAFQSLGTEVASTTRTLFSSRVRRLHVGAHLGLLGGLDMAAGVLVEYEVRGDGFLRHMVRSIVGTLVDIGGRRLEPAAIAGLLQSRDRHQAGRTVPAEGLCLVRVDYA